MATITVTADLTAPPEAVWSSLQDFDRYPEWLDVHEAFDPPPPRPPTAGDRFVQRGTLMGMRGDLEWTVEHVTPAQKIVIAADTPLNARLRVTFLLERRSTGTRMTCVYEMLGLRVAGLLVRAVKSEATKHTRSSLAALDTLVSRETHPQSRWEEAG